jgi:hypothetical protein
MFYTCPRCKAEVKWEYSRRWASDGIDWPDDDNPQTVNFLFSCNKCRFGFTVVYDIHAVYDEDFDEVEYKETRWVNEFENGTREDLMVLTNAFDEGPKKV